VEQEPRGSSEWAGKIWNRREVTTLKNNTWHVVFSLAAGWPAARFRPLWFNGPHEGTHELAIQLWRDRIHVYVLAAKKLACILDAINSGWLNLNPVESVPIAESMSAYFATCSVVFLVAMFRYLQKYGLMSTYLDVHAD